MTEDTTTQCYLFPEPFPKKILVQFDGDRVSSDGGAVLLKALDERLGLSSGLAECLRDSRQSGKVVHELEELLRQRLFAISCGYPDGNDSARLAADPVHKLLAGRDPVEGDATRRTATVVFQWLLRQLLLSAHAGFRQFRP